MNFFLLDHYNFQPGATSLRLLFHSDASGSGRGFRVRYKMVRDCNSYFYDISPSSITDTSSASCFTRISETSGTINTPYHSKNYPANLDCVYQFARCVALNDISSLGLVFRCSVFKLNSLCAPARFTSRID